jgi:transcriptional regulator with XRE-family HTH domain
MEIVAARAQCSRQTLARLESGSPEVSVGVLARVLNALQMPDELLLIAYNVIYTQQRYKIKLYEYNIPLIL